ncbi:MAG: hypothetical protein N3B15_07700 [Planctomycetota bacterium]|nr:hypothetical protein [Planctomycetota bacterium]
MATLLGCAQRALPTPPALPPLTMALDGAWQWRDGERLRLTLQLRGADGSAEWVLPRHRLSARYRLQRSGESEGVLLLIFERVAVAQQAEEQRALRLTPEWFSLSGVRAGDSLLMRLHSSECFCPRDVVLQLMQGAPSER